jgi:hypothetical protein
MASRVEPGREDAAEGTVVMGDSKAIFLSPHPSRRDLRSLLRMRAEPWFPFDKRLGELIDKRVIQ